MLNIFDYDSIFRCWLALLRGFGLQLRASGGGLRASGFGALGLHVFGVEVASCIYSGNRGNGLGKIFFPFAMIQITHTGEGRV